jgi:hypothetical protein
MDEVQKPSSNEHMEHYYHLGGNYNFLLHGRRVIWLSLKEHGTEGRKSITDTGALASTNKMKGKSHFFSVYFP